MQVPQNLSSTWIGLNPLPLGILFIVISVASVPLACILDTRRGQMDPDYDGSGREIVQKVDIALYSYILLISLIGTFFYCLRKLYPVIVLIVSILNIPLWAGVLLLNGLSFVEVWAYPEVCENRQKDGDEWVSVPGSLMCAVVKAEIAFALVVWILHFATLVVAAIAVHRVREARKRLEGKGFRELYADEVDDAFEEVAI